MAKPSPKGSENQENPPPADEGSDAITRTVKAQLKNKERWVRGLYMLLFFILYNVAETVLYLLAIYQFGATLINGKSNPRVRAFGRSISRYIYDIMQYFTYNTEKRPFPFNEWVVEKDPLE
ncbi:MAG: DUF4389 domain-containing protein [Gammaproteobacteria bacterium]|nr:DUF4389 domain-containing protein [Gammaproteobacteria bacterium]